MKAHFTEAAGAQLKEALAYWREHRPEAPRLIQEELRHALKRIRSEKVVGKHFGRIDGMAVRKLLLKRSKRHVYFSVDRDEDEILIHAVWGAQRGSEPEFE